MNHHMPRLAVVAAIGLVAVTACSVETSGSSGLSSPDPVTGVNPGDQVFGYGNSSFRFGITELSSQKGMSSADDPADGGWSHQLTAPTPGVPGDSGSAFLDGNGRALGTLSTMSLSLPVENAVGDLGRELAYAREHSGIAGLRLVLGTEPFDPSA